MRSEEKSRGAKRWVIVLAGGEGTRIRPLIEEWLGAPRPKQYCQFFGDQSMLERTLRRATRLTDPGRILTVIGNDHRRYLASLGNGALPGTVIEQPRNLETAPGVFLPLSRVMACDPEAIVVVMPSDHHMDPEERTVEELDQAVELAESFPERILLLAAVPDGPETDYGWIEPGAVLAEAGNGAVAREVMGFREKPSAERAAEYFRRGYLWNTMIVVGRAGTLWQLGRRALPEMTEHFEMLRRVTEAVQAGRVSPMHRRRVIRDLYADLEPANFSRDLLEKVADSTMVLPLEDVNWSDWGRPERISRSLARIGARPNFAGASGAPAAERELIAVG